MATFKSKNLQQDILTDNDLHHPQRPGWKEKFAAWLLLVMGLLYSAAQIINYLSSKSTIASAENDKIVVNRGELVSDVNTFVYIIFALFAGILLLRGKRLGWMMGLPFLLFFCFITGAGVIALGMLNTFDLNFVLVLVFFVILLTAVIFLLLPSARKKYRVGKQTWLPALVFLLVLCSMFFFLK